MIIFEDIGQKTEKHTVKNQWFYENGIEVMRVPLPVGDYIIANDRALNVIKRKEKRGNKPKKLDFLGTYSVTVDTKENIGEILNNICGKAHDRFRDECILAQNNNVQLYVLVENEDGVTCIKDLEEWKNPRLQRYEKIKQMHDLGKWYHVRLAKKEPASGRSLAKSMMTMERKYGVRFLFCNPKDAGKRVVKLLSETK